MKRRGISLHELLVVVSLVAILLPLCGKLMWTLAKANRAGFREMEERRNLLKLVSQLKTDSLQAEQSVAGPEPRFESSNGRTVRYLAASQGIERRLLRDGEIVHRDRFFLQPGVALSLQMHPDLEDATLAIITSVTTPEQRPNEIRLILPVPQQRGEVQP